MPHRANGAISVFQYKFRVKRKQYHIAHSDLFRLFFPSI